ncbi:MAG: DUF2282 domain-containing protein [Kangiellaceae bacterium]|nr:DUF2282 domain-containing protein [Kangiellaceae bacterium]
MQNTTKSLTSLAIAGLIAAGLSLPSNDVQAAKKGFEKCYGVAKKGKNDCGTSKHSCAGMATIDADAEEWVYVPEGTCEKIVGGSITKPKA